MNKDLTIGALCEWLKTRQTLSDSRQLLILSDTDAHKNDIASANVSGLQLSLNLLTTHYTNLLFVSNSDDLEAPDRLEYSQLQACLGQQYSAVILDCREGWLPNHIYAASGLVQASGILALLTPPQSTWADYYAEYSIVRFSYSDAHQHSWFANYMSHYLSADKNVAWLTADKSHLPLINDQFPTKTNPSSCPVKLSNEQSQILQEISQSWADHKQSCHFVSGRRGRGKSTLLAKLCDQVLLQMQHTPFTDIALCAASQAQRDIIKSYMLINAEHKNSIQCIPPDQTGGLHQRTLLIIDEAASIAPNLLTQLCEKTEHAVLCATTQGYEGSGRGLIYRWLPNAKTFIHTHALTAPFRWRDNDALEAIMESLFEPTLPPLQLPQQPSFSLQLLSKELLLENPTLLKSCIALLQQAHYQSTPTDILRMLDADDHRIWAFIDSSLPIHPNSLLGVICTIAEGGNEVFSDNRLCEEIALGKRRVQGHMSLQAIASGIHEPHVLKHKTYRIHRIAVRPEHQGQNIGSSMLTSLHKQRAQLGIDGFSTSFGLTKRLETFWQKNNYALVKIGHRKDTSSGSITGHYLYKSSQLYSRYVELTRAHTDIDTHYLQRYRTDLTSLLPVIREKLITMETLAQSKLVRHKLRLYSQREMSYAMSKSAIFCIVKASKQTAFEECFNRLHRKHLSQSMKQELLTELTLYINRWLNE